MVTKDISNFVFTNRLGKNALDWKFYANVLVTTTTRRLFRKDIVTTERRNIYKKYTGAWCYVDDGVYLPSNSIEEMVRAWEAQHQSTIEEFEI